MNRCGMNVCALFINVYEFVLSLSVIIVIIEHNLKSSMYAIYLIRPNASLLSFLFFVNDTMHQKPLGEC